MLCVSGYDENRRARELLNDIQSMRITADYSDGMGERTASTMLLLSHFSPTNHHIKVSTSTRDAKVNMRVSVVHYVGFSLCGIIKYLKKVLWNPAQNSDSG